MSKLLCVIIDGLRTESLACAHVPCFDGLARDGLLSRRLQLVHHGLTLPNLVSVLTSLPPEEHGVVSNSGASPVSPHAFSLFSLLRYRHHNSAAFYSNDRLRLLFPQGSLQTAMLINSQGLRNVDRELAEQAARHLQREKPECCLLYLEGAEITGTHFGFSSEPYRESIEQADRALGMLVEHLHLVGLRQDYVIMILGCGSRGPRPSEDQPSFPLLLAGPSIRKGVELEQPLSLFDLAPTMAAILGLASHPDWRGRVITEVFLRQPLEFASVSRKKGSRQRRREALAA
jgi:predicted AlkP superfamily pyrophosphatase or phosphodiesterase